MKNILLAAIFVSCLLIVGTAWSVERAGEIVSVRGSALIERDTNELPAKRKMELHVADSVTTGDNARLKMLFRDDSILTLGAESKLLVEQYLFSAADKRADSVFTLLDGKLRAVVGSEGFQVKTPTAYAGARGTIFLVWYDAATRTTGIAVLEGQVAIRNINPAIPGEQLLNAGERTSIPVDDVPALPQIFDQMSSINADLSAISDYALEDFALEIEIDDASGGLKGIRPAEAPQLQPLIEPTITDEFKPPFDQTPTDDNMATTPVSVDFIFNPAQ